jgi:hypothetical protein
MGLLLRSAPGARRPWRISSAIAALAALLLADCADNRVSDGGSSSGVDNPSLTLGFVDASGAALRVSGELNVYAADQNPAIDPDPLLTLKIKNSGFTKLTGSDFTRLQIASSSGSPSPLSKSSAASSAGAGDSAVTLFNLVLKTQQRTGSLVLGFKYDSAAKAFSLVDDGKSISRFDLKPKPLVRYAARVGREPVHGQTGRIFVPGTPFLATLIDSIFVLEDLPEGKFPLRLLSGNGKVYPMPMLLDSKDSTLIYRPAITPLSPVDTAHQDPVPDFEVFAGEAHEAFVDEPGFLEGKVTGNGATDPRLSLLWRLIKEAPDSPPVDTLLDKPSPPPPPPHKADIRSPTQLRSEVRFKEEGVYEFALDATIGVHTKTDTVVISVRRLPPTVRPRIIKPGPGEIVAIGKPYDIHWEMPAKGPVTIQVSVDTGAGAKWVNLAQGYPGKDGLAVYPWTPSSDLGASAKCLIQILNEADTTMRAKTEKPFTLVQ